MDNQHHWPLSGHWYRSPRLHCLAGKGISRHIQEFTEFTTFHVAKNLRHWPFSLKEMRSPEASWNSTASAWPKMTSQKPTNADILKGAKGENVQNEAGLSQMCPSDFWNLTWWSPSCSPCLGTNVQNSLGGRASCFVPPVYHLATHATNRTQAHPKTMLSASSWNRTM